MAQAHSESSGSSDLTRRSAAPRPVDHYDLRAHAVWLQYVSVGSRLRAAVRDPAYDALERFPRLWRAYIRLRTPHYHLVTSDTDIVVDGFQGSAQTFAQHALLACNPERQVASHMHNPAHLVVAVRMGLPTILVLREPVDAVASWVGRQDAPGATDPVMELRRWEWFHRRLMPHLDGMVIASFDQVTAAFGDVVREVNRRFDESFVPFPHDDPTAVDALVRGMRFYSVHTRGEERGELASPTPSVAREGRVGAVRDRLLEPDLVDTRADTQRLYDRILAASP